MRHWRVAARAPRGTIGRLQAAADEGRLAAHLEDAAHFPGGHSDEIVVPVSEADVAAVVTTRAAVLAIGAQSSLTGGATPMGETLLSTARLLGIESLPADRLRVGAGVPILEIEERLKQEGRYYPPGPTFAGAFAGGTVSTNAAGAATFRHGTTRRWIDALTIVLADGSVLDLERGMTVAHPDGYFDLDLRSGPTRVPIPTYRMPRVAKLSAGYFAAPEMDLIDLFIGSEGTLGVITAVTLRVLPSRPSFCLILVTFDDRQAALDCVAALRGNECVSAIEHMDRRCLQLVREDGTDRSLGISLADDAEMALLVTLELPPGTSAAEVYDEMARSPGASGTGTAITRIVAVLADYAVLDHATVAAPGDRVAQSRLLALREAVPAAVNQRVGRARQTIDARIEKTAADMIVPVEHFSTLLDAYQCELAARGLDAAIWGHISDGNVHPNIIPRSFADVESGREAILAFGRESIRLGGAPLAEHGVGRNATKQRLLRELYGERGVEEMQRVKAALDPEWKLAPGVIFPRPV